MVSIVKATRPIDPSTTCGCREITPRSQPSAQSDYFLHDSNSRLITPVSRFGPLVALVLIHLPHGMPPPPADYHTRYEPAQVRFLTTSVSAGIVPVASLYDPTSTKYCCGPTSSCVSASSRCPLCMNCCFWDAQH